MKNKNSKKVSDKKALKKSEILRHIADETGLTQKDIAAVFDSMTVLMKKNLVGRKSPGEFTIPNLIKIKVSKRAATKTRQSQSLFRQKK